MDITRIVNAQTDDNDVIRAESKKFARNKSARRSLTDRSQLQKRRVTIAGDVDSGRWLLERLFLHFVKTELKAVKKPRRKQYIGYCES